MGRGRGGAARRLPALFAELGLAIDASDPARLVLFPEMDARPDVPEITESCWGILGKQPGDVMCAGSRMVVKRRGAARPAVVSCTLLPYDQAFELGATLAEAGGPCTSTTASARSSACWAARPAAHDRHCRPLAMGPVNEAGFQDPSRIELAPTGTSIPIARGAQSMDVVR